MDTDIQVLKDLTPLMEENKMCIRDRFKRYEGEMRWQVQLKQQFGL